MRSLTMQLIIQQAEEQDEDEQDSHRGNLRKAIAQAAKDGKVDMVETHVAAIVKTYEEPPQVRIGKFWEGMSPQQQKQMQVSSQVAQCQLRYYNDERQPVPDLFGMLCLLTHLFV